MNSFSNKITVNPQQCGGQPCIRGMRIRVVDILDLLGSGLNQVQILAELPDLELEDINAAILFARNRINHPIISV
ncbi:MAG: hypothetical protein HW421_2832 [Ignavibacteria bacterium]|nr:hypothetical protein [Ignavibacteria bacterium]